MSCIEVNLLTQLKAAAGCGRFEIECNAAMPVSSVLCVAVDRYKELGPLIFNDDGIAHGWLMIGIIYAIDIIAQYISHNAIFSNNEIPGSVRIT